MLLTLEIEELEARIAPGLVCAPDDHGSKGHEGSKGDHGSKSDHGSKANAGSKDAHAGSKDSGSKCV